MMCNHITLGFACSPLPLARMSQPFYMSEDNSLLILGIKSPFPQCGWLSHPHNMMMEIMRSPLGLTSSHACKIDESSHPMIFFAVISSNFDEIIDGCRERHVKE